MKSIATSVTAITLLAIGTTATAGHRHDRDGFDRWDRIHDFHSRRASRTGLQFRRGGLSFYIGLGNGYGLPVTRRWSRPFPAGRALTAWYTDSIPRVPAVPRIDPVPAPTPLPPAPVSPPAAVHPRHSFGEIVDCAVPLYDCVRIKDPHNIAPYARPVVVAVRDPRIPFDDCPDVVGCVYVEILVPQCALERVRVSSRGGEVELDFGRYEIDLTSCDGVVTIDYDD